MLAAVLPVNGINVITAEWMKKGDQEKNDVMVAEWQMLVDAFKDNGIEVVEVEARPEFEVMTFARDYGCMIKEGAVIGTSATRSVRWRPWRTRRS